MNKKTLSEEVSRRIPISSHDAERCIDTIFEAIQDTLANGESVRIVGFGEFSTRVRHARMGVDPQNPNARIAIPQVIVPKFKAGKGLKTHIKESAKRKERIN